jgi:selenide,water dikinase
MGATVQVLRDLPRSSDPNLLVGAEHFDDAGVYRLDGSTGLVTTVDFFPPLVDDPYVFGRIAAANALSDVYAMGGRPVCALNIVGFPDKELPIEVLVEILRGGAERVQAAGAAIAGGHSVRDSEVKYGLSVTGLIHPDRILTNGGAKPGDVLVLTKPLGSGILTTAAKQGKIAEADLAEAIDVMTDLNAAACEAALAVGVHACTDITGFGLIGHAFEMAEASGVTIEIEAARVPLMARAYDLARAGIVTRAHKSNLEHVASAASGTGAGGARIVGVDEVLVKVLADAQTSGGLLLSVAADRVERLVEELRSRNTRSAAVIGRLLARGEQAIVIR